MPPVYVHHLFWHAPLAFCAFHTYGRKNNDDTDDSVYTGIEYNRNHDAKHKIVLLWIFKNEFVKHPEFLMQGLFFRHASVSSTYPVSPSIRLCVTFFLRISILSASLSEYFSCPVTECQALTLTRSRCIVFTFTFCWVWLPGRLINISVAFRQPEHQQLIPDPA